MEIPIRVNLPDQDAATPYGQKLENVVSLGVGIAQRPGSTELHDLGTAAKVDGLWDWQTQSQIVAVSGGSVFTLSDPDGNPIPSRLLLPSSGYFLLPSGGYLLLPSASVKADVTNGAMTAAPVRFADFGARLYMASGGAVKELGPQMFATHGGKDYTCILNNIAIEPGVTSGWATYWQDDGAGSSHTAWDSATRYTSGTADSLEDAEVPTSVKFIATLDRYLFALEDGTQRIHFSIVDEPWSFDSDWISSDSIPDKCTAILSHNGELWCAGPKSIQSFNNDGVTPWVPSGYGEITSGVYAPYTFISAMNTLWYIDDHKRFVRLEGRSAVSVNHALDTTISSMAFVNDATAQYGVYNGTNFILLHFPTGQRSILINLDDGIWSEQSTSGAQWDANCIITALDWDMVVMGSTNGEVRRLGNYATDDGAAITTKIRTPRLQTAQIARVSRLVFGLTRASVPSSSESVSMTIKWRDDGSQIWSTARTVTIDDRTDTDRVVTAYRFGAYKQSRQWEFTVPWPYALQKVEQV